MSAEERIRSAGFKKIKNDNGEDSCLFCDYYHLSSDKKEATCSLHGVRFWEDFEASEHICNRFNGGTIDSLFSALAQENTNPVTAKEPKPEAPVSQKTGWLHKIFRGFGRE